MCLGTHCKPVVVDASNSSVAPLASIVGVGVSHVLSSCNIIEEYHIYLVQIIIIIIVSVDDHTRFCWNRLKTASNNFPYHRTKE